jgi:hypothetical protein
MNKYIKSNDSGQPKVFSVKSVSEYIDLVTQFSLDGRVIFRGQTEDLTLVPSVGRNIEGSVLLRNEKEMFKAFKRESFPYINLNLKNDWQWLAIAQHNRLPTRLLDWTNNPLVALWFAVKDPAITKKPCIVWAYSYDQSDAIFNTKKHPTPFSIKKTYIYFPEHVSPFIQAQSGVFTVHHKIDENTRFAPLEEINFSNLLLKKIEIPSEFITTARYHLFRIGISPASLFPGLLGIADKIRYENMLGKDELN